MDDTILLLVISGCVYSATSNPYFAALAAVLLRRGQGLCTTAQDACVGISDICKI